jgi:hypothetical protein
VKTDFMGACFYEERMPNTLIAGAQNDFISLRDEEGVVETAQCFDVQTT